MEGFADGREAARRGEPERCEEKTLMWGLVECPVGSTSREPGTELAIRRASGSESLIFMRRSDVGFISGLIHGSRAPTSFFSDKVPVYFLSHDST